MYIYVCMHACIHRCVYIYIHILCVCMCAICVLSGVLNLFMYLFTHDERVHGYAYVYVYRYISFFGGVRGFSAAEKELFKGPTRNLFFVNPSLAPKGPPQGPTIKDSRGPNI